MQFETELKIEMSYVLHGQIIFSKNKHNLKQKNDLFNLRMPVLPPRAVVWRYTTAYPSF